MSWAQCSSHRAALVHLLSINRPQCFLCTVNLRVGLTHGFDVFQWNREVLLFGNMEFHLWIIWGVHRQYSLIGQVSSLLSTSASRFSMFRAS